MPTHLYFREKEDRGDFLDSLVAFVSRFLLVLLGIKMDDVALHYAWHPSIMYSSLRFSIDR
jgi:hypothetical protein